METLQEQIFNTLQEGGLNWTVNKEPLIAESDGQKSPFYAMRRSDNGTMFGTCKETYVAYQNEEMVELAYKIQDETGYNIEYARPYGAGERVAVRLKLKDETLEYPEKGDVISRGILITNSHDATGALRLVLDTELLSCENGMTRWIMDSRTSIRHTTNMRKMLDEALVGFDVLTESDKTLMENIKELIGKPLEPNHVDSIFKTVLDVDSSKVSEGFKSDVYSTRRLNQVRSLYDSIKEEIAYKGDNLWGLVNGVTHYTTHKAGTDKNRQKSKVFGELMRKDTRAFDFALSV